MTALGIVAALAGGLLALPDGVQEVPGARPEPTRAPRLLDQDAAQAEASATGKPVEVTALRSATNTTMALPNGSFELTARTRPVRAKVRGVWKDIDTTLVRARAGWTAKAVNNPAVFSAGTPGRTSRSLSRARLDAEGASMTPLATLDTAGHRVTLSWPGPLPEPVVKGPRALYPEVLPGVDLLLTARDSGFSHVLVVKTAAAGANAQLAKLSYGLSSPDLTFTLDPVTKVVSAKDREGKEIAASPSPYMWDSAGRPEARAPGTPSVSAAPGNPVPDGPADVLALPGLAGPQPGTHDALVQAGLKGGTLTLVPDTKLLKDPKTVYPVFIDPPYTGGTNNWTTAYRTYPSSSFWNGTNFNDGTDTARVGYESTTGGLSRSFFTVDWEPSMKGARVTEAYFYALETYSWSCTPKPVELWLTGAISSGTTWNTQPAWSGRIESVDAAHGYSGSCPDDYVRFTTTATAQTATDHGWPTVTLGMRATDEKSSYPWKKFKADGSNAPYMKVTYNRAPHVPDTLSMSPGPDCDETSPFAAVGASDLVFAATGRDDDGDLRTLQFAVWKQGSSTKIYDQALNVDAGGRAGFSLARSNFTDGQTYQWAVRSIDSTGAASEYAPPGAGTCTFVYDATKPNSPTISSTVFPEDDGTGRNWSTTEFGTAGQFTFGAADDPQTVKYQYAFNGPGYDDTHSITVAAGASATISLKPPVAGPNMLYVRALDGAGNPSDSTGYRLNVSPRDTSDAPGDTNGDAQPDLWVITPEGNLDMYSGAEGDLHMNIPGAHRRGINLTADGDKDGKADYPGYWVGSDGKPALITHHGDFAPGDGIQDLLARMPDGKLYVYRGDGYGSVDIEQRTELWLPSNAPAPSTFTQIFATGDLDNDRRPELLVTAGTDLWAFTGYTGSTFSTATKLASGWDALDVVNVGDINKDGAKDLLFRNPGDGKMWLRKGKSDGKGGTDVASFASGAASLGGVDVSYGGNWTASNIPMVMGTPDTSGDGIPDLWALTGSGTVKLYRCTTTDTTAGVLVVVGGWSSMKAFG
ncbi:FG-GAP-like repeat-containing protein [Streptomyces sp. NPDC052494]|uniref:FG-GAP-like repeat-containing protein n=1 Tax=Streptomyces sp. NPDC052494 TaxID=3365692 RepID=UPI0037CD28C1